jgi:hypothetical protein
LRLTVGERVQVGERDRECPEFVFVTASHGSGWVPARHLSGSSGAAVVQTPYDTTELPTRSGEVLDVLDEDLTSGWLWCRGPGGRGRLGAGQDGRTRELITRCRAFRLPKPTRTRVGHRPGLGPGDQCAVGRGGHRVKGSLTDIDLNPPYASCRHGQVAPDGCRAGAQGAGLRE